MQMVGEELIQSVTACFKSFLPAREIVHEAYKRRFELHPGGQLMELSEVFSTSKPVSLCQLTLDLF